MKFGQIGYPFLWALIAYYFMERVFPQKKPEPFSPEDLRGGDTVKLSLFKRILNGLMSNRSFKVSLITLFAVYGGQQFGDEIIKLLASNKFDVFCSENVSGSLEKVCTIIKENELNLHTESVRKLIIDQNISSEDKINLLKIKLDYILSSESGNKRTFLILCILGLFISMFSGIAGLCTFLSALLRLFQDGKLSKALYKKIVSYYSRRGLDVPAEYIIS